MPLSVLKNTPTHAVVVLVNTGAETANVSLASLALAGTQTAVAPVVNIKAIHYALHSNSSCTINRNATALWHFGYTGTLKFDGFVDNRQNTSDISIVLSGGGSVVLELIKVRGYGDTEHIPSV